MYTAIMVDSEPWALKSMALSFPWAEFGFELICKTVSPHDAFEKALLLSPDVLFTDIAMPSMSGIELMQQLREQGSKSLFVVISEHAHYEHMRSAILLAVFDYLLKPLNADMMRDILARLAERLREHKGEATETAEVENHFKLKVNNAQFVLLLKHINDYYGEMLHITKLSKRFFINTSYCCKLFEINFGKNFSDYVKEIRMKKAVEMLSEGIAVKEVAARAGYTDYYYFMKAFKKYYGVTPTAYQKGEA